jgi:hypothetical protein
MPDLISYLIQASVSLALLYLFYSFLLSNMTFFHLKRIFLLFGIFFSTIFLLFDFSLSFPLENQVGEYLLPLIPTIEAGSGNVTHVESSISSWNLLIFIYWIGVAIMACRLVIQFYSIEKIYRSSIQASYNGWQYQKINKKINPFSFWEKIYINPELHGSKELNSILYHENVHVKELHTIDVLFSEFLTTFFWFNPFAYLFKDVVKKNLEHIADYVTLKKGVDRKAYQYSLLRFTELKVRSAIAINYKCLTIKGRIAMMNKRPTSKIQVFRFILLLPMLLFLLLFFHPNPGQLKSEGIAGDFMEQSKLLNFNLPFLQSINKDIKTDSLQNLKEAKDKNPEKEFTCSREGSTIRIKFHKRVRVRIHPRENKKLYKEFEGSPGEDILIEQGEWITVRGTNSSDHKWAWAIDCDNNPDHVENIKDVRNEIRLRPKC